MCMCVSVLGGGVCLCVSISWQASRFSILGELPSTHFATSLQINLNWTYQKIKCLPTHFYPKRQDKTSNDQWVLSHSQLRITTPVGKSAYLMSTLWNILQKTTPSHTVGTFTKNSSVLCSCVFTRVQALCYEARTWHCILRVGNDREM